MEHATILVLGGSSVAFIKEALQTRDPPNLILYVRTPSKLPQEWPTHPNITIIQGSLSNESLLNTTFQQHNISTVVSFLGAYITASAFLTRDTSTPIADTFPLLIQAMKKNDVRHLMALSTPSFWVEGKDVPTLARSLAGMVPKIVVPQGNAEMKKIGQVVSSAGDGIEWTVFRVPVLTNGEGDLPVFAGYAGPNFGGSFSLSRRSMGRWVLGEIRERKWIGEAPVLGND